MTTPQDPHSRQFSHVNGSAAELLDRLVIAEICKGWPVYRDNSEWKNFRSLFTDNAVVWTTWSGLQPIDKFIDISKEGKAKGARILHRENGTLVELNPATQRAVGKMKATITQRFSGTVLDKPVEYDVDCDCRFLFFCARDESSGGTWKARYVKLVYEKDKVCPVDGRTAPEFDCAELAKYPEGYKYLGAAQASLGHAVDPDLATFDARYWGKMYECMEAWLAGAEDPGLCWAREASGGSIDDGKDKVVV